MAKNKKFKNQIKNTKLPEQNFLFFAQTIKEKYFDS